MDMRTRINTSLKEAMKSKDAPRLSTLRLINAAIKDREIAARGGDEPVQISDGDILGILGKMVKQRQESARAYDEGGRLELAEKEREEIALIETFLPKQLSEAEVLVVLDEAGAATGASSLRDMGKVMGVLKEKYTGQLDFGAVGGLLKKRLG